MAARLQGAVPKMSENRLYQWLDGGLMGVGWVLGSFSSFLGRASARIAGAMDKVAQ